MAAMLRSADLNCAALSDNKIIAQPHSPEWLPADGAVWVHG
jgi:hypothetical protein